METSPGSVRAVVDSLDRVVQALTSAGVEMIPDGAPSAGAGRGVRLLDRPPSIGRRGPRKPASISNGRGETLFDQPELLQAPADGVETALRDEPGSPGPRDAMIMLHLAQTDRGEVSVTLHSRDGTVGYYRDGLLQTLINAQGQNLAGYVEAAVARICGQGARRVLVLGHGGGGASMLLHRRGIEVTSVDVDPLAERLGQLFFRAPPTLSVVTAEAGAFVAASPAATFDAVLVDFQDSATPPADYLAEPTC